MKKLILIFAMIFCLVSVAGAWDDGGWDTSKVPYIKKTAAPTVTDDSFGIPYLWCDTAADKLYLLIDNTPGAAVWDEIQAGTITTLKLGQNVETLSGTKTLVATDLVIQKLDPDGSDRDVGLPAEADSTDLVFWIYNTANGAGEDLTIKDDSSATIVTLGPGMGMMFSCDGTSWIALDNEGITYDAIAKTVTIAGAGTPLLRLIPSGTGGAVIISIVPSGPITSPAVEWDGIKIDASALDPGVSAVDVEIHGIHSDMSGILRTRVPEAEAIHADGMAATAVAGQSEPGVALHAVGKVRIDYDASNLANGIHMTVLDVIVDVGSAAAGEIHVLDVAIAGTGTPTLVGLATHTGVTPVKQYIGTFASPGANYAGRRVGGFYTDNIDGQLVFASTNDSILVGSTSTFKEIKIVLTTAATKDIKPQFFFNTAENAWTRFYPADDTDGMQRDGTIRFEPPGSWSPLGDPDVAGGTGSDVGYWIYIIATRVGPYGAPRIATATILAPTEYGWDANGKITAAAFVSDTITVTAEGPTDAIDVSGVNIVLLNTGSNNVTIGSFTGGVSGQRLAVVIINATNDAILEHAESTGDQDIYLSDGADETISAGYGGWLLTCNGTHWYEESIGGGDLKDDQALYFGDDSDYWLIYDSSDTRWELWTSNGDGADADTMWAYIEDGTDDFIIVGALIADSVTTTPNSAPAISFIDIDQLDATDSEVTGRIYNNITTDTDDATIGDMHFQTTGAQGNAGTLEDFMHFDGSLRVTKLYSGFSHSVETITCVSDAGTATIFNTVSLLVTDTGDTDEDTVSLADSTVIGQIKIFVYLTETDGTDSINVTPNARSGFAKIHFEDPGDGCTMIWDGAGWAIISNNGGTIS